MAHILAKNGTQTQAAEHSMDTSPEIPTTRCPDRMGKVSSAPADTVLSPGTPVGTGSSGSAPAHGGKASQGMSGVTEGQILAVSECPD